MTWLESFWRLKSRSAPLDAQLLRDVSEDRDGAGVSEGSTRPHVAVTFMFISTRSLTSPMSTRQASRRPNVRLVGSTMFPSSVASCLSSTGGASKLRFGVTPPSPPSPSRTSLQSCSRHVGENVREEAPSLPPPSSSLCRRPDSSPPCAASVSMRVLAQLNSAHLLSDCCASTSAAVEPHTGQRPDFYNWIPISYDVCVLRAPIKRTTCLSLVP